MIKSIKLENFQSHKNSALEFHPGLNIIVGTTDSGKSAILRALRYVVTNKPLGDDFRSNWGGDTEVVIETEETWVTRTKSKTENSYVIHHPVETGKEPTIYKAFGADVPQEIRALLDMEDVNLQAQMDSPFLISKTSGEAANHFSKIANIDIINTTLVKIKKWLREHENIQTHARANIKQLQDEIKEYDYLEIFEKEVEVLESMEQHKRSLETKQAALRNILDSAKRVQEDIEEIKIQLKAEDEINEVLKLYKDLAERNNSKSRLVSVRNEIKDVEHSLEEISQISVLENPVQDILQLYATRNLQNDKQTAIKELIEDLQYAEAEIKRNSGVLNNLEQKFVDSFPDVCPLCENQTK